MTETYTYCLDWHGFDGGTEIAAVEIVSEGFFGLVDEGDAYLRSGHLYGDPIRSPRNDADLSSGKWAVVTDIESAEAQPFPSVAAEVAL